MRHLIMVRARSRRSLRKQRQEGIGKALVCSDPDLIRLGDRKVTDILDQDSLAYEIYSDIKANPTIENVQKGVAAFKLLSRLYSSPSAALRHRYSQDYVADV